MPVAEILASVAVACGAVVAARWMWPRSRRPPPRPEAVAEKKPPRKKVGEKKLAEKKEGLEVVPRLGSLYDEEDFSEPSAASVVAAMPVVFDREASEDEPTLAAGSFSVSASARSDRGRVRGRNEDSFLLHDDLGLFIVADGMGGYRGGDVASDLAVRTIRDAFLQNEFEGRAAVSLPSRVSKLARAIHMANQSIRERARAESELRGMGTTVVAALFAPEKHRVYIGHVGDSRCYRLRSDKLEQLTSDHTMGSLGVRGDGADQLSRAVGTQQRVPTDVVVVRPAIGDVYLLCSDGLPKMVSDEQIKLVLSTSDTPTDAAERLVAAANERGGKDNVTAVVVRVEPIARAAGLAS